jgi:8-oxo-dGTP diphosphatase
MAASGLIYYSLGFCFSEDRKSMLAMVKNRPDWQKGLMNGIGGKVNRGEQHFAAMMREFEEETGARVDEWENFAYLHGLGFAVAVFRAFSDHALATAVSKTDEMVIRVSSYSHDWPIRAISNLYWLVPLALDQGTQKGKGPDHAVISYGKW